MGQHVSASSFMHFNFFASLTRIRNRDFRGASAFLLAVLSLEGATVAMIQIAAMRKLCFVDLLSQGRLEPLPAHISKRCPLISALWENLRAGRRDRLQAGESHGRNHGSRGDSNSIETLEDIYPNILLPSKLRDLIRAFHNDAGRAIDVADELQLLRSQLVRSKDWGLAQLLPLAKRRHTLKRMSQIYYSIPVSKACAVSGCSSARELLEVCQNSLLGFDDVLNSVCLERREEFLVYKRSQRTSRLASMIDEVNELKYRFSLTVEYGIA